MLEQFNILKGEKTMIKKSIFLCLSVMFAISISSTHNIIHAEDPIHDVTLVNVSDPFSEEESESYIDEETGKVIDPFVKPGMADLSHLNKSIEIAYKKSRSFFCSKSKKIFYSNVKEHLFNISDSFKFAGIFKPYNENLCNAQVIITQMQELSNIINRNSKCISWSTRSTALSAMHKYFSAESIMPGIDFSSGEVGADDMVAYLKSYYKDNDSLMLFIQSLANRMEIFEAIIYYA